MSTILIVEDEPLELSVLQNALGTDRFEFECASSGSEARALLNARPAHIDAILLDWELPDVEGIEFLEWIRGQPELADVEVVIESESIAPQEVRASIERGAYYYLTKPYDDAQLQAIIEAAVESCELKRTLAKKVDQANDVLRLLDHGTFHVRTLREAEALAVRLAASCNAPDVGVGLLELLVNAVEHGNLGITYDDKSKLLEAGRLQVEIQRRLKLPENRDKRVVIELDRDVYQLRLQIEDCGPGFDYRNYLKVDPKRLFDAHGRGILVANSALVLEYQDPGNRVIVSLSLSGSAERVE